LDSGKSGSREGQRGAEAPLSSAKNKLKAKLPIKSQTDQLNQ